MSSQHSPPILIDGPSGSGEIHHLDKSNILDCVSSYNKSPVTMDLLPVDVVLYVFHFVRVIYAGNTGLPNEMSYHTGERDLVKWRRSWWYPLIHVCGHWRSVIFASPNFLDLRLVCVYDTPMELIGIWPPFPIIIRNSFSRPMLEDYDFDAAIMHRNRVCEIDLKLTSLQLERWPLAMQVQFPALTHLGLTILWESRGRLLAQSLPDGFLGGFAPNLKSLELSYIPFPALPKFLLSATDLVRLFLWEIPHSGYISPEVFITALAVLVNLKCLFIGFESPESSPDPEIRRPLLPSRTLLPALTSFTFRGASEYVEVLVAQIDAPLLDSISMIFFHQFIFDTPQLAQFMRRATGLKALNDARVDFLQGSVWADFFSQTGTFLCKGLDLTILCRGLERQLSSVAQLFTSFFPSIYTVEHLYILWSPLNVVESQLQDDMERMLWLETFQSFTAVKNLYVSEKLVQGIAHVLEELVEARLMDVFPVLESLFLEGFQSSGLVQEAVGRFVAARQLLGHTIGVFDWDKPEDFCSWFPSPE